VNRRGEGRELAWTNTTKFALGLVRREDSAQTGWHSVSWNTGVRPDDATISTAGAGGCRGYLPGSSFWYCTSPNPPTLPPFPPHHLQLCAQGVPRHCKVWATTTAGWFTVCAERISHRAGTCTCTCTCASVSASVRLLACACEVE
jgi:hypothetical protein